MTHILYKLCLGKISLLSLVTRLYKLGLHIKQVFLLLLSDKTF